MSNRHLKRKTTSNFQSRAYPQRKSRLKFIRQYRECQIRSLHIPYQNMVKAFSICLISIQVYLKWKSSQELDHCGKTFFPINVIPDNVKYFSNLSSTIMGPCEMFCEFFLLIQHITIVIIFWSLCLLASNLYIVPIDQSTRDAPKLMPPIYSYGYIKNSNFG